MKPARPSALLTYLNQPKPVRVVVKAGVPNLIDGKRVAELLDRWRTDDTWWRTEQSRMYFECLLEDHRTITVFQDLNTLHWFSQRYGGAVPSPPPPPRWKKPEEGEG